MSLRFDEDPLSPLLALIPADRQLVRHLLQTVTRLFYSVRHILVLDYLCHVPCARDEQLATRLRTTQREVHRMMVQLRLDGLVGVIQKNEVQQGLSALAKLRAAHSKYAAAMQQQMTLTARQVHRQWYYIDYPRALLAVKYRLYKLQSSMDQTMRLAQESRGYACPSCQVRYSSLDVQRFLDPLDMLFHCETCGLILEEQMNEAAVRLAEGSRGRMMKAVKTLIEELQKVDKLTIPKEDMRSIVEKFMEREKQLNEAMAAAKIAQAKTLEKPSSDLTASSKIVVKQDESINVNVAALSVDLKDSLVEPVTSQSATQEQQRIANQLPVWHTHSTVTGERLDTGPVTVKTTETTVLDAEAVREREAAIAKYYADMQQRELEMEELDEQDEDEFVELDLQETKKVKLDLTVEEEDFE